MRVGWGYEIRGDLRKRDASPGYPRRVIGTITKLVSSSAARLVPILRTQATKLRRDAPLAIPREANRVVPLRLAARESARGLDHPDADSELPLVGALYQIRADLRARDASRPIVDSRPGDPRRLIRTIATRVRASAARLVAVPRTPATNRSATIPARSLRLQPQEPTAVPPPIVTAPAEQAPMKVRLRDVSDRNGQDIDLALLRLAARESARGFNHPDVASELHLLGALYHEARRYDEALAFYSTALAIRQRTLGPDHSEVASTLVDLEAARRDEAAEEERAGLASRGTGPERTEVLA